MQPVVIAPWPFNENTESDLILISSDCMYFYTHKLLLSLVSPVFNTMLTLPPEQSQEVHDGRPCMTLSDKGKALQPLLSWCDPRCANKSLDLNDLRVVLELADKYDMESITKQLDAVMACMKDTISANPILMYAIAMRYHLENLARAAAKGTLRTPFKNLIWDDIPETEYINSLCFQNLLQYHRSCAITAVQATKIFDWLDRFDVRFLCDGCKCKACFSVFRSGTKWPKWWLEYMEAVAESLDSTPCSPVSDIAFLQSFYFKNSRGRCHSCRKNGFLELLGFSKRLSMEVERRISLVR